MTENLFTARQVRAVRAWLGISQTEFARRAGVSLSALTDFETGKRAAKIETRVSISVVILKLKTITVDGKSIALPE